MARKSKNNKIYNASVALKAGDSFRRHAHIFISHPGKDINVAHEIAARDIGGLISSATTLSLAIELYLKSLRIIAGLSVPEIHHLWTLYKSLPSPLKDAIEFNYNKQNPIGGSESAALELAIDTGSTNKEELKEWKNRKVSPDTDVSLKGILMRSSNAFQSWRYLHEHKGDDSLAVLTYEYLRLDLIARLLREFAVQLLHNKLLNQTPGAGAGAPLAS